MTPIYLGGDDGTAVVVTDQSAATLIVDDATERYFDTLCIQNTGSEPCWVKTGQSDVTATTLSIMLPPQWREVFAKGRGETYIAAVCAAGKSTTLVVTPLAG